MKYIPASEVENVINYAERLERPWQLIVFDLRALLFSAVELPEPMPVVTQSATTPESVKEMLAGETKEWDAASDEAMAAVERQAARPAPDDKLREALEDDELATKVARDCHDSYHDKRWCSTCEAREAGIDEYRAALRKEGA